MRVCVLLPSYARSELLQAYAACDPPRDLSPLAPDWSISTQLLDKATVYRQLKNLKQQGFDVFVNLCEGHLEWDVPSVDVIHALEALDVAYTGPSPALYEPRKISLKRAAIAAGVCSPRFVLARSPTDAEQAADRLRFPVFVKPNEGGDSFGVDAGSLCADKGALMQRLVDCLPEFDALMIEEYVAGREFSVLVVADPLDETRPRCFQPVEFIFPEGAAFKTYELKNEQYHPGANVRLHDAALSAGLMDAASRLFVAYQGVGYCRFDFRTDATGQIYAIDANFTCSFFYPEGYYGTADYILQNDGFGVSKFLRQIVEEGLVRHRRKMDAALVHYNEIFG
jgi:D-alanine-D-alanine ligase